MGQPAEGGLSLSSPFWAVSPPMLTSFITPPTPSPQPPPRLSHSWVLLISYGSLREGSP